MTILLQLNLGFAWGQPGGVVVPGPYCVAEGQFSAAGVRQGEVMETAGRAGEVFTAGVKAGQTCCEG